MNIAKGDSDLCVYSSFSLTVCLNEVTPPMPSVALEACSADVLNVYIFKCFSAWLAFSVGGGWKKIK